MNYGGSSAAGSRQRGNAAGQFRGDRIPENYEVGQLQQFTPQQMKLLQQMMGRVGKNSDLAGLAEGDEEAFNQMEAPAMRQFQELTGQNASRFSNAGMGARRGSGFQNYQNQATSDFAMELSARRQDLMRQARNDLFNMSSELLGKRPYERTLTKQQPEEETNWGGLFGGAAGGLAGGLTGGLSGAFEGASKGYQFGSQF